MIFYAGRMSRDREAFSQITDWTRSTGYGSIQVWLRYLRKGVVFQQQYQSSLACRRTTWNGPAFQIGGGYTWSDLYREAERQNVVVVGGGTPVSVIPRFHWLPPFVTA